MRVVSDSSDRLVLRDVPWLIIVIPALLCGLFGYAVWIGVIPDATFPWPFIILPPIVLAVASYSFECLYVIFDRPRNEVCIARRRNLRRDANVYALSTLRRVGIVGTPDSDGGTCRIALYFDGSTDPVALTFYETNSPASRTIADRIESWLSRQNI